MRLLRLKVAVIAASVCAMALFAGAGAAFADTGVVCTIGSSSGNTVTCFSITGSGLHVINMHATATIENSDRTLQLCIHGPDPALPLCSQFTPVGPGQTLSEDWNPNRDVAPGTYCARTWRLNNDGSHTLIGQVCFIVQS
jgi:hypothetical protein